MRKINVIMRNEDIDSACVTGKVVVVINTLFSTSAIVHALAQGAEAVHVQGCWQAAIQTATGLGRDHRVIAEPHDADASARFAGHAALAMNNLSLTGHSLVLACRATSEVLYMAGAATHLYIAALLNSPAMAARLIEHAGQPIELICTGPNGRPSLIDLYCAGYLVEHLMQTCRDAWVCSDSALIARSVYRQYRGQPRHCLDDSLAATLLTCKGLAATVKDICEVGLYDIVPHLRQGAVVNSQDPQWAPSCEPMRTQHHGL